jgi:large subunit ribosomal protein L13
MTNDYTIDAKGKRLGRVASEAAALLMGKNSTEFSRNKVPNVKVKITNVSKLEILNKKMESKEYKSYSGYPGGLKLTAMKKLTKDKGFKEPMRIAIYGMLPKNKLRSEMIKNLNITE